MGGLEGRLNALIEASAQGERAESTSGRSGSLPPFRRSSEAELSAAGMAWTAGALSPEISPPKARSCAPSSLSRDRRSGRASVE
jgi:hypothetical protein